MKRKLIALFLLFFLLLPSIVGCNSDFLGEIIGTTAADTTALEVPTTAEPTTAEPQGTTVPVFAVQYGLS